MMENKRRDPFDIRHSQFRSTLKQSTVPKTREEEEDNAGGFSSSTSSRRWSWSCEGQITGLEYESPACLLRFVKR